MMLVGRPGLGKTPPLGFLYKPIREHDDRMYEKYNEEWDAYEKALASSGTRAAVRRRIVHCSGSRSW